MTPNTTAAPFPAPSGRFGQCEAVGVVLQPDWPAERLFEVFLERLADKPRGIGVFHPPGDLRQRARNSGADTALADLRYQGRHNGERGGVVAARGNARLRNTSRPAASSASASILVPPMSSPMRNLMHGRFSYYANAFRHDALRFSVKGPACQGTPQPRTVND